MTNLIQLKQPSGQRPRTDVLSMPERNANFLRRRARAILNLGHATTDVRDGAIDDLRRADPSFVADYAQRLAAMDDPTTIGIAFACHYNWLTCHTASTDQIGQARIARLVQARKSRQATEIGLGA